jgi:hypothetical protein
MKTFTCWIPGDTFGFDAVTMGDVDGDGTTDFLITSGWKIESQAGQILLAAAQTLERCAQPHLVSIRVERSV